MSSTTTSRLEGLNAGVAIKAPVRVATTANITLSGLQTIDGVTVAANDRVLVKDQNTASQNGIYLAQSSDWVRATDFDGSLDVVKGTIVTAHSGSVGANNYWRVTSADGMVIGTSAITFSETAFPTGGNDGVIRGDDTAPAWNMFIGTGAGNDTTTTLRTTLVGVGAGQAITSGNLNTAFGSLTLNSNTSGAVNTAVGADALGNNTTGEYNQAFGCKALANNTTGARNTAVGQSALLNSSSASDNIAIGQDTLIAGATVLRNVAVGNRALTTLISGNDNVAVGTNALYYSTADNNVAVGKDAMFTNSTGASNNAIGYQALYSNTTGNNNAALGQIALYANTTGTGNTGLGHRAGYGAAGDEATTVDTNCTFIGINASRSSAVPTATVLTNSTAIGNDAKFTKSNQVSLGDNAVTEIRAPGPGFLASTTDFTLSKTSTAGGTTGAQTINKPAGSVNFAAAATSLVVTNSLVTASSVIIATVATNDSTMKSVAAVAGSGSFTLHANAAATAETRVSFLVIN